MFHPVDHHAGAGLGRAASTATGSSTSPRRRSSRSSPAARTAREHAEYRLDGRAAPRAGPAPAVGSRLLRLRAARCDRACVARSRGSAGVVRAAGLLLLEPGGDLRPGRRDPLSGGQRGARLRARGRGGDRRRPADRRVYGHERLVCPRPSAQRDEGRSRPGEGQGLRDLDRPDRRHRRRVSAAPKRR